MVEEVRLVLAHAGRGHARRSEIIDENKANAQRSETLRSGHSVEEASEMQVEVRETGW